MIPGVAGKGWMCLLRASPIKSFMQAVRFLLCQTLPAFFNSAPEPGFASFAPSLQLPPRLALRDRCQKSPLRRSGRSPGQNPSSGGSQKPHCPRRRGFGFQHVGPRARGHTSRVPVSTHGGKCTAGCCLLHRALAGWALTDGGAWQPGRERPLQRCAGSNPRVTEWPCGGCAAGHGGGRQ